MLQWCVPLNVFLLRALLYQATCYIAALPCVRYLAARWATAQSFHLEKARIISLSRTERCEASRRVTACPGASRRLPATDRRAPLRTSNQIPPPLLWRCSFARVIHNRRKAIVRMTEWEGTVDRFLSNDIWCAVCKSWATKGREKLKDVHSLVFPLFFLMVRIELLNLIYPALRQRKGSSTSKENTAL